MGQAYLESLRSLRNNSVITLEPSRKPLNLLVKKLNADVSIRLKNDVEYHGKMIDADSHMNIILEGATEHRGNTPTANYGNVIVRGSNILYICVESGKKQA
jgi:small nuclear ribonucleoprotein